MSIFKILSNLRHFKVVSNIFVIISHRKLDLNSEPMKFSKSVFLDLSPNEILREVLLGYLFIVSELEPKTHF